MATSESRLSIANQVSLEIPSKMSFSHLQALGIYLYAILAVYGIKLGNDFTLMFLGIFFFSALGLTHYQLKKAEEKMKKREKIQFSK